MKRPALHPPDDMRAGLRPPQFGLRVLLLGVGGLCVVLAAMKWLSPSAILVLFVLLFSVIAHIAGNVLGTQLRDAGNRKLPDERSAAGDRMSPARTLAQTDFAPPSQLTQRDPLGTIVFIVPVLGAAIAAVVGGFWLGTSIGSKATLANMAFGIGAFAVIGGILGFLLGTFLKVLLAANVEAWRNGDDKS